jgi:hypothetical protein
MLRALQRDGFLVPSTSTASPNANAFLRPKTQSKAAFIADLRAVNSLCDAPIPPFSLPTPNDIAHVLCSLPPHTLWGCTLDITNFFWSLKLPPFAQDMFRIHSLTWPCLPFGWNRSPVLAQRTLARLIDTTFQSTTFATALNNTLFSFHYYDDILILATSASLAQAACTALCTCLQNANLILSPKSVTVPAQQLVWLGKHFDLAHRTIQNRTPTLLHALALTLLVTSGPCHPKLIDRVAGYLMWVYRPHSGFTLYMNAWYKARWSSRRYWHTPSTSMCLALFDTFSLALRSFNSWPLPPAPLTSPVICADAAFLHERYQVGLFSPSFGIRMITTPLTVTTQQIAELFSLDCATRLATRLGWSHLTLIGDNLGSLQLLLSFRPTLSNQTLVKTLRRIHNRLLWSGLTLALLWVPSTLQPADFPSRCPLSSLTLERCINLTYTSWCSLISSLSTCLFLGFIQCT